MVAGRLDPGSPRVTEGIRGELGRFWAALPLPADRRAQSEYTSRRYVEVVRAWRPLGSLEGRKVLDLGGGVGGLSAVLHAAYGGEYDVADYYVPENSALPRVAPFGIRSYYRCELTGPDPLNAVTGGPYDVVILAEVLEHLFVNPRSLFREVRRRLRGPGLFVLTTPNQARLTNRVRLLLGRSIRDGDPFSDQGAIDNGHVIEYAKSDLLRTLRQESFEPVALHVRQNPPSPPGCPVRPESRAVWRRIGLRLVNSAVLRPFDLGDEILGIFRSAPHPGPSESGTAMRGRGD